MKMIINRKMYNTDTAQKKGCWGNELSITELGHCTEILYQKKTGEFFLFGEGGPLSKYAKPSGNSSWRSGSDITPLTIEDAKEWAEGHLTADAYEELFGSVAE